jgi:hypothetical protein
MGQLLLDGAHDCAAVAAIANLYTPKNWHGRHDLGLVIYSVRFPAVRKCKIAPIGSLEPNCFPSFSLQILHTQADYPNVLPALHNVWYRTKRIPPDSLTAMPFVGPAYETWSAETCAQAKAAS